VADLECHVNPSLTVVLKFVPSDPLLEKFALEEQTRSWAALDLECHVVLTETVALMTVVYLPLKDKCSDAIRFICSGPLRIDEFSITNFHIK